MKRVSFVTWRAEKAGVFQAPQTLCVKKIPMVADAAVLQASRNPVATSYQESRCLFRFEHEPSIKQLLQCWKNKTFALVQCLASLANLMSIREAIQIATITQY